MQNLTLLLAAAVVTSTAAAQTNSAAAPGSAGPSFASSDTLPDSLGYDDAFALYEIRIGGEAITEEQQLARWQGELKAGRARAGMLAGNYLAYRALTASDCAAAREALIRADELGNDQSSWLLAQLAQNASCGAPDRAELERWLKKSVTLDYFAAAVRLIDFYAPADGSGDPLQRYVYARVAGGYAEAVSKGNASAESRPGYDAVALQAMEKDLSAADRARGTSEAARILEQMLKRHERFLPVRPVEFARDTAGGKAAHEFVASTLDYHHECQWNLRGNCAGAQRLAFVAFTSKSADFLSCKIDLKSQVFGGAAPANLSREFLVGPMATRTLVLGDINEQPARKAITVTCLPLPNLAANAKAGKCRSKLKGSIDAENFYPPSARSSGIEGSAVVRYFVPPGAETVGDAEIVTSSGNAALDDAALATIFSGKFTNDCAYGLSTIRIAFKLSN
jgi:TonB family protein